MSSADQVGEPPPETAEHLASGLWGERFPGDERAVPGRLQPGAGPVGDECSPQVGAIVGVLHVEVDLDVVSFER